MCLRLTCRTDLCKSERKLLRKERINLGNLRKRLLTLPSLLELESRDSETTTYCMVSDLWLKKRLHRSQPRNLLFLLFACTCPSGAVESPLKQFWAKSWKITMDCNHAERPLFLGSIRMCVNSASQILDPSTSCLHLSFFYFPHLPLCSLTSSAAASTFQESLWWGRDNSYPSSSCSTSHHHSLFIKGINSKSPRFCLLAKCTVWMHHVWFDCP